MDLREVVCSGVIDGLVSKQEAAGRSEAVGNRGCVEPLVSLTVQLTPMLFSNLHFRLIASSSGANCCTATKLSVFGCRNVVSIV